MECGADDLFCQVLSWVSENEFVAGSFAELMGRAGAGAAGVFGAIAAFLREHGQAIIGLLGVSFGVFKWWRYREQILHKRLAEYLRESDLRLKNGQTYVLEAIQRPGPKLFAQPPLFANNHLRSVLRERRWDNAVMAASVEQSADIELSKATQVVERQIRSAEDSIASLREQCATANILRGAILAARDDTTKRTALALDFFRTALKLPEQESNVLAKELEAHQLRKLGWLDEALTAYEDFERIAAVSISNERERGLAMARAKRYRAEILQFRKICAFRAGLAPSPASGLASNLMTATAPNASAPGALTIRKKLGPFTGWDLIEGGDMNYFTAFVSSKFTNRQAQVRGYLDDAHYAYEKAKDTPSRWFRSGTDRLHQNADDGLQRVKRARQGAYDCYDATLISQPAA